MEYSRTSVSYISAAIAAARVAARRADPGTDQLAEKEVAGACHLLLAGSSVVSVSGVDTRDAQSSVQQGAWCFTFLSAKP